MSNEQLLGLTANNLLCPNQIIPQSLDNNWLETLEPSSQVAGKTSTTGQLPLFTINSFQSNISALAGGIGQSTDPFTNYSAKNFLTNRSVTSGQFFTSAVDSSFIEEIDPVRQKITAALQKTDLVGQPDSSLTKIIDIAQQQIASFFQQPDVGSQLALAFGQGVDPELAKSYSQQLPNIEIVPDSILGKANGAYAASTNTIFLAHSLVARGDQQEIVAVLTEEIGHSIDAHINTKDSAGDEGEIFAKLVSGHLERADYLAILSEDDHSQIIWHDQVLDVENSNPPSFSVVLANDSGSSNTDRLTKDAGIRGQVSNPNSIAEFKVSLDGSSNQINLRNKLQSDGTFNLTDAQVRQLVGSLGDGSHTLAFTAKDAAGSQSSFNLSFVLDTTAPQLTFTTPNIIKNDGKLIGQIADSNLEQLTYQWDSGSAKAISLTNGSFNQALDFTGIANGTHTLTISALDKAGNLTVKPYAVTVAVDLAAPVISARLAIDSGSSSTDGITNSAAITGTVIDDNTVTTLTASFDGINFVNILPQRAANGSISITAAQLASIKGSALTDGAYTLRIKAQDQFGNTSAVYSVGFTLDTTAAIPGQLSLAAASDSGISNSDKLTNVKNPKITGTGEVGSIVKLLDGTQQVGQTTVGSNGTWQIITTSLADGQHQLTAQQTDLAGNISSVSPALAIQIDSTAPVLTFANPGIIKNDGKLVGQLVDSNLDQFTYQWDTGTAKAIGLTNGNFNQALDFTGIANGTHTLTLTAVDKAGNITVTPYNVTLAYDRSAPIINANLAIDSGTSSTDGITNNAAITGTVTDDNNITILQASLDGTNFVNITRATNGSISLSAAQLATIKGSALTDGVYNLRIKAQDQYGNASSIYSVKFTLDSTVAAPSKPILDVASDSGSSNADQITSVKNPKISGTGEAGNTLKLFDGNNLVSQTTVGNDGIWQIIAAPNLTEGQHQLTAKQIDLAGNTSSASAALKITVDSLAPQIQLKHSLTSVQNGSKLTGVVDETGSGVAKLTYQWDSRTAIAVTVSNEGEFEQVLDLTGLTNGSHSLKITSTDLAGNSSAKTLMVQVNLPPIIAAQLVRDTAPASQTNSDKITFDPQIKGVVTGQVNKFVGGFDGIATSQYVNILPQLSSTGSFSLSLAILNQIFGGALSEGTHTLHLIASIILNGSSSEDDDENEDDEQCGSRGLSSNGTENRVKGQKKSSKTASEKGLWNDRSSPFCTDSGKAKEYRPSILMC